MVCEVAVAVTEDAAMRRFRAHPADRRMRCRRQIGMRFSRRIQAIATPPAADQVRP